MSAQSMINAALDQGVGPVCMRPGMGTSARTAPVPASAPTSVVITNAPSEYAPSDGMTSCQFRFNPLRGRGTCATVGTPTVAVHVLRESLPVAPAGTHLCAFHSPFDVRTAPVPARGVSLAKATDDTEFVLTCDAGDESRVVYALPGWVARGLFRNSLSHLGEAFARLAPKTLAPKGLPEGELSL